MSIGLSFEGAHEISIFVDCVFTHPRLVFHKQGSELEFSLVRFECFFAALNT
jgi:hypothetical protein